VFQTHSAKYWSAILLTVYSLILVDMSFVPLSSSDSEACSFGILNPTCGTAKTFYIPVSLVGVISAMALKPFRGSVIVKFTFFFQTV
jgi:hypothetical protein